MVIAVQEESRETQLRPNNACPLRQAQGELVGLCAFSSSFPGLGLIPAKWDCLIPPPRGQRQLPTVTTSVTLFTGSNHRKSG